MQKEINRALADLYDKGMFPTSISGRNNKGEEFTASIIKKVPSSKRYRAKIGRPNEDESIPFKSDNPFYRRNIDAWDYLDDILSDKEYRVADKLCRMASPFYSCLNQFGIIKSSTLAHKASQLNVDRRVIGEIWEKLVDEEVIALGEDDFWYVNPYVSFNGNRCHTPTHTLFVKTKFATNNY